MATIAMIASAAFAFLALALSVGFFPELIELGFELGIPGRAAVGAAGVG